ncbi:MAG: hypothetical protein ACOC2Q_01080 [Spirochaetota bacterium]
MKNIVIPITIAAIALLMLAGCGEVTELVLEDTWAIEEIRAGDLITTDLDDYLEVTFDASNDEATLTVGPDWDELSNVEVTGTFDFTVDGTDKTITLSQSGDPKYVITYELENQLDRMVWMSWVAVDRDPTVDIVGDSAVIEYIAFNRQTSS